MKTRFRNYYDLANAWVDAVKDGKNVKLSMYGDRMYSNGNKIFSYGDHYCIANVVETAKGKVVLFNEDNYSSTTGKHKAAVSRALGNRWQRFDVPNTYPRWGDINGKLHLANVEWMKAKQEECLDKAKRAWKYRQAYLNEAASYEAQAKLYVDYFPEVIICKLLRKVA